jgi:hypothetical protein
MGPFTKVSDALVAISATRHLDGAILDLNLDDGVTLPVARVLRSRGIPFVVLSASDAAFIVSVLGEVPLCRKPTGAHVVVGTLSQYLK